MKTSGMDIRNHKKRGQWAELRFMTNATELGFQLAKPLGDTAQYDVIVDLGGRFISVQVKSTFFQASNLKPGNFVASLFHINGPNRRYETTDFDYLAVYCIPIDLWYIIPPAVAARKHAIRVYPGDKLNQFEHYNEAWHLYTTAPCPPQKKGNRFDLKEHLRNPRHSRWWRMDLSELLSRARLQTKVRVLCGRLTRKTYRPSLSSRSLSESETLG